MNAAACVITRTPRHRKITPILISLHWLPVKQRILFKVLCLTYKARNNEAPAYLRELCETLVLKSLHWLPVSQRIIFKVLCLTYKALNNEAPAYLSELPVDFQITRALRSSTARSLVVPLQKLKYGERAFSFAAPTLWNQLRNHIKLSGSTATLKKKLKYHIFSEYYE